MDFDIDAVLDQLERTLNQSDHEEKETKPVIETSPPPSTSKKSADDLLLLDLDPLGNTENHHDNENEDKLERLKQDLQDLYATSTTINLPTPTLPDIIGQQEELSSVSLPVAVEQLELEVRHEVLQHTLEQSSPLLPDITTLPNNTHDDIKEINLTSDTIEEEQNSLPISTIETTSTSNDLIIPKEPDLIQHEISSTQTSNVLHSVDSIVNAPSMVSDAEDFVAHNPPIFDMESTSSSSELIFTLCNDNEEESIQLPSEESVVNNPPSSPSPSPPPPLPSTTTTAPTQDFDLVKNILSEIFDKPDEEILDENLTEVKQSEIINNEQQEIPVLSSPSPPPPVTTNNEEDFRFLEEMLASMDVPDTDIHQLTPAEIDRVDNLLKQIVNQQQTDEIPEITDEIESTPLPPPSSSSSLPPPSERPSTPPLESSISSDTTPVAAGASASAIPVDEELIRVEQEWAKLTDEEKRLGTVAPTWISDDVAPICMKCSSKFSITRRRHHCRACGKVFCSTCCWQKVKLIHDDSKEDRACNDCVKTITDVEYLWNYMRNNQKPRTSVLRKKTVFKSVVGSILYGTV